MGNQSKIFAAVAVVVIVAVLGFWYVLKRNKPAPAAPAAPAAAESSSLGSQIYQQSQNPIQNKVPTAGNPAINPIEGVYKNPF